jgi:hypothetical protein
MTGSVGLEKERPPLFRSCPFFQSKAVWPAHRHWKEGAHPQGKQQGFARKAWASGDRLLSAIPEAHQNAHSRTNQIFTLRLQTGVGWVKPSIASSQRMSIGKEKGPKKRLPFHKPVLEV